MDPARCFGDRLRAIREKRGLTQAELAELIDRSLNVISRLERGLSKPTFDNLCGLAKVLRVPAGDFFAAPGGGGSDPAALRRDMLEAARVLPLRDLKLAASCTGWSWRGGMARCSARNSVLRGGNPARQSGTAGPGMDRFALLAMTARADGHFPDHPG